MSIELDRLTKRYDDLPVVDDVSMSISAGELFVLLGPSGSGKSTLLRMIAGLASIDGGRVILHGRDVTGISPKDRGIGFVFQHYALFRHMTVADNVEFALRVRKVSRFRREERREELLQLVGLSGFGSRYPRQLSGGQQQRVALARALAHEPDILLLDEPFGALDAKIRIELRLALRTIQRELGLTTVFVTHDQEEAFELADRLAVLHRGRLIEAGRPRELYLRPRSPFVATFLGAANLVVGESSSRSVWLGAAELPVASETSGDRSPRRVQVLFRPEDLQLTRQARGDLPRLGSGVVDERAFVGAFERLRLEIPRLENVRGVSPTPDFGSEKLWLQVVRPQHEAESLPLDVGDEIWVAVRRFHVLAPASMRFLLDTGASPGARAAREVGEAIAQRIEGHLSFLGNGGGAAADTAAELPAIGAETESGAEGFDVAVLALEPDRLPERLGTVGLERHHLLLVPGPAPAPSRLLVCVAVGEPGKADIRFAERLAWQLGAQATVLTVIDGSLDEPPPPHVSRFLSDCERALGQRGVVARAKVRSGPVEREIRAEIAEGGHDLVVLGAPIDSGRRRSVSLEGPVERLVRHPPPCPILVVRRQETDGPVEHAR